MIAVAVFLLLFLRTSTFMLPISIRMDFQISNIISDKFYNNC